MGVLEDFNRLCKNNAIGVYDKDDKQELVSIETTLKSLEKIHLKDNFKLVGNCLLAKNIYAEDGWVFVKEIEDEEELTGWKELLSLL